MHDQILSRESQKNTQKGLPINGQKKHCFQKGAWGGITQGKKENKKKIKDIKKQGVDAPH